tara:strand:- start:36987 stop:37622 length:636 start_codon:yes stop_codon:yes gene_type:complete
MVSAAVGAVGELEEEADLRARCTQCPGRARDFPRRWSRSPHKLAFDTTRSFAAHAHVVSSPDASSSPLELVDPTLHAVHVFTDTGWSTPHFVEVQAVLSPEASSPASFVVPGIVTGRIVAGVICCAWITRDAFVTYQVLIRRAQFTVTNRVVPGSVISHQVGGIDTRDARVRYDVFIYCAHQFVARCIISRSIITAVGVDRPGRTRRTCVA